jgi:AcrR family transcriptional regulator
VSDVPTLQAPARAGVTSAGDATAERLLDAAERLIGERGLAGASVRAICADAGANVAAVHYHFGSKDALVDAVLARRMADLAAPRFAMLEPLEALELPPVHAVVGALVRPLAEFARDPDGAGRAYVRFLAALVASDELDRIGIAFMPQYDRLAPLLDRALPDVSREVLAFRLDLVRTPLFETLADPERAVRHWPRDRHPSYDDLVDALVDAVTGTLTAPASSGGSA